MFLHISMQSSMDIIYMVLYINMIVFIFVRYLVGIFIKIIKRMSFNFCLFSTFHVLIDAICYK